MTRPSLDQGLWSAMFVLFGFFFFFSSRRRHTRWTGDWSSDVCSSDLDPALPEFLAASRQTLTMCRDIEDKEFKRSAHYDIVRRPWDIDHSLYCRVPLPDGSDVAIGLQRSQIGRASCRERGEISGGAVS